MAPFSGHPVLFGEPIENSGFCPGWQNGAEMYSPLTKCRACFILFCDLRPSPCSIFYELDVKLEWCSRYNLNFVWPMCLSTWFSFIISQDAHTTETNTLALPCTSVTKMGHIKVKPANKVLTSWQESILSQNDWPKITKCGLIFLFEWRLEKVLTLGHPITCLMKNQSEIFSTPRSAHTFAFVLSLFLKANAARARRGRRHPRPSAMCILM